MKIAERSVPLTRSFCFGSLPAINAELSSQHSYQAVAMYTSAMNAQAYVHQAELMLAEGTDPAAVGAMVTVALCGHWEHDGPCRWPHHNQIDGAQFRTVFIATPEDEPEVRRRIRTALHGQPSWLVLSDDARTLATDEQEVAARLAQAPRRL